MSDEELVKRLRDEHLAMTRNEALTAENKRMRALRFSRIKSFETTNEQLVAINEALTAENKRMRAIVTDQGETLAVRFRRIELLATTNEALEAKLAECEARLGKAMEGLRNIAVVGFSSDPSVNAAIAKQTVTQARAIIAEIRGEKG
jgi:hypothetical protein